MRAQVLGGVVAVAVVGGAGVWLARPSTAPGAVAAASAPPRKVSNSPGVPPSNAAQPHVESKPNGPDDMCQVACAEKSDCKEDEKCSLGCCVPLDRAEQRSPVTRSGHELLTLLSAAAAVGESATLFGATGAPDMPGQSGCSTYACAHGAKKVAAFSAIMGVRWADLMGFRAGPLFAAQQRCLSAVAQDNEEVQYDHALRRRDDAGPQGGVRAIAGIRTRLLERFVDAALSDDGVIQIADGGGAQDHFKVIRSFFLLGRALHIVQDSFSTYHAARRAPDYTQLLQVNSYVCSPDAPPHPHETPGVLNLVDVDARSPNGDIVRLPKCEADTLACLKPEYVKSVTASKELWLAFGRARTFPLAQRKEAAEREILPVLDKWFKVPASVPHAPTPAPPCAVESVAAIEARRHACLRMTGTGRRLEAPFDWNRFSFSNIP